MSEIKIYLEVSEEIDQFLIENSISIYDILDREGIEATVKHEVPIYISQDGARSKDLATVILASGASIFAIGLALSHVLRTVYRRPHFIEYYELEEIKDANGRLIVDSWGNPQFKKIKKFKLVEPRMEDAQRGMEITAPNGLVIKIGLSEKQLINSGEKNS